MSTPKAKKTSGTCSTCAYWESQQKQAGECHRFPPVLIQSVPGSHLLPEGKMGIFPVTQATTTCGEFKSPTLL